MVQCPEAHLFCTECMVTYAETKLGAHDARIVCMDQSGCKLPFPESELRRFLTPKLLELYERVKQRKEIEAAGIEGLEECPFCEYKVVIENEQERLFRCENEACGAVTCRTCKKLVRVLFRRLCLFALPCLSVSFGREGLVWARCCWAAGLRSPLNDGRPPPCLMSIDRSSAHGPTSVWTQSWWQQHQAETSSALVFCVLHLLRITHALSISGVHLGLR